MAQVEDKQLEWLREAAAASPSDYAASEQLIGALRERRLLQEAATERSRLEQVHGQLLESTWLLWCADAAALAEQGQLPVQQVMQLHERAMRKGAGASVQVARSWAGVARRAQLASEDIRRVYEQALGAGAGGDLPRCAALWRDYLDWEEELDDVSAQQTARVRQLYARQLRVPMEGLEDAWQEYDEWEEDSSKRDGLRKVYEEAMRQRKARRRHEEAIERPERDEAAYAAALAYAEWEVRQHRQQRGGGADPLLVRAVYERALRAFPHVEDLWLRYAAFDRDVLARAHVCLPWSGKAAAYYALSVEDDEQRCAYLEAAVDRVRAGGVDAMHLVYAAWETTLERAGRPVLEVLEAHKRELPQERGDLWAEVTAVEARHSADPEALCRQVVDRKGMAQHWALWQLYLAQVQSLERRRGVHRQAAQKVRDYPALTFAAWLQYEQLHGTAETLLDACMAIDGRWRAIAAQQERVHAKRARDEGDEHDDNTEQPEAVKRGRTSSKKERTVFVKNLPFGMSEDRLRAHFAAYGELVEVRLVRDQEGKSRGFGFIEYSDEVAADAALQCHGQLVQGRPIHVSKSRAAVGESGAAALTSLYVTNLPYAATEEDVRLMIEGGVEGVRVATMRILKDKRTDESKGAAFVEFAGPDQARPVLLLSGALMCRGRTAYFEAPKPKKAPQKKKPHKEKRELTEYDDSCTVYVGNIPADAPVEELRALLHQTCGAVKAVRQAKNPTRAYVDFEREEGRQAALAIGAKLALRDQLLEVSAPKPRRKGESLHDGILSVEPGPPPTTLRPRSVKLKL